MTKFSLFIYLALFLTGFSVFAEEPDTTWKRGGIGTLQLNQVSLQNWAAGGDNAVSVTGLFSAFANYEKDKTSWDNAIDLCYGVLATSKNISDINRKSWRKNEDRFEANSKFGYRFSKLFLLTAMANFRTQFAKGFSDPTQTTVLSDFMAPGFLTFALGVDHQPWDFFSVFLSPVTGKFTFVLDPTLANAGAFGVTPAIVGSGGSIIQPGRRLRQEFGSSMVIKFQKDIAKNVNLKTGFTLFNNFTDPIKKNRGNIDVNGDVALVMKINEFLSASIIAQIIYDHDIVIRELNDVGEVVGQGPRTQIKQALGIGLSSKF